jgi:hypothetical protein
MNTIASYKELAQSVKTFDRITVKTCWIAHVMGAHGLTTRVAPNRKGEAREEPCPGWAWEPIERALRHKGMIK